MPYKFAAPMLLAVSLLFSTTILWAAPAPCSPTVHPVTFQNAWVRMCEGTTAPGTSEPLHTHSQDVVILTLGGGPAREDFQGAPPPQRIASTDDDANAIEVQKPYTHTAANTGSEPFRVLVVELMKPRSGKPGTQKPTGGAVVENSRVRIFRYTLKPGESAPMHKHSRPYVIVSMKPMTLSMTDPQGRNFTHEVAAGDAHFQGTPVTHDVKNAGKTPGEVVEIELK